MISLPYLFVESAGWVLLHSLWQFTLIAVVIQLSERIFVRTNNAVWRYRLGVCGLVALTVAPAITLAVFPVPFGHEASEPVSLDTELPYSPLVANDESAVGEDTADEVPIPVRHANWAANAWSVGAALAHWSRPFRSTVVTCWLAGMAICSLRPALGCYTLRNLRNVGISAVEEHVFEKVNRLVVHIGISQKILVFNSTLTTTPLVVGYLRPMLLLPLGLAAQLPPMELEAILAHELAHIRRHDFLVNLWQLLLETVFFYHPAVWILSHRLRIERENCCDDLALSIVGDPVCYGRALLHIDQLRRTESLLAMGARGGSLTVRIQRLFPRSAASAKATGSIVGVLLPSLALLMVVVACTWGAMPRKLPGESLSANPKSNQLAAIEQNDLDKDDSETFANVLGRLETAAKAKFTGGTTIRIDPPSTAPNGQQVVTVSQVAPQSTTTCSLQFRRLGDRWVCCGATSKEVEVSGARYEHRLGGDAIEVDQLIIWLGWRNTAPSAVDNSAPPSPVATKQAHSDITEQEIERIAPPLSISDPAAEQVSIHAGGDAASAPPKLAQTTSTLDEKSPSFAPDLAQAERDLRLIASAELNSLAGEWEVFRGASFASGKHRDLSAAEVRMSRVVINDKGIATLIGFDLEGYDQFVITLNPMTSPRRINFHPANNNRQKRYAGVYEFSEGVKLAVNSPATLKLAINLTAAGPAPATVSPTGAGSYLVLARRGKNQGPWSAFESDEPLLNDPQLGHAKVAPFEEAALKGLHRIRTELLTNRKVLMELGCDLIQVDQIMDRMELAERQGRALVEEARKVAPPISLSSGSARDLTILAKQREALWDAHSVAVKESRTAAIEVVDTMLNDSQRRRLRQLQLQAAGHEALTWTEIEKELGVTDEQRQQLAAICEWAKQQSQLMASSDTPSRGSEAELRHAAIGRALALFSDEQKSIWGRLVGEPFKLLNP